jgi:DedD protein
MALPSFLRRKAATTPSQPADAALVQQARSRARRRLIGAVVLLGLGVIAFPLLFETEPRPIPVDLPIEIPPKEGAPPLAMPPPASTARAASARVIDFPSDPAPPPASAPAPLAQQAPASAAEPALTASAVPPARPRDDGTRARALLDGAPVAARTAASAAWPAASVATAAAPVASAASAGGARWVVQVGAFAEDKTVREVRAKVEKLGLVTYTQVVKADAGDRTRVRLGPFPRREDADAAVAKLKGAGLPAAVLKL